MTKKILVIGSGDSNLSELAMLAIKEKHGDDIILVTPEEAKEQGLKMEDFDNIPKIEITPLPEISVIYDFKSGKENRRERRAKERKLNNQTPK